MKKDTRPSWLPLAAAVGIPAVLVIGALLLSRTYIPRPGPTRDMLTTLHGVIYISVKVTNADGSPAADRNVTFTHTHEGKTLEALTRSTDSAGFSTTTVTKVGDVTVTVDGSEKKEVLTDVGNSTNDSYDVKFTLD